MSPRFRNCFACHRRSSIQRVLPIPNAIHWPVITELALRPIAQIEDLKLQQKALNAVLCG